MQWQDSKKEIKRKVQNHRRRGCKQEVQRRRRIIRLPRWNWSKRSKRSSAVKLNRADLQYCNLMLVEFSHIEKMYIFQVYVGVHVCHHFNKAAKKTKWSQIRAFPEQFLYIAQLLFVWVTTRWQHKCADALYTWFIARVSEILYEWITGCDARESRVSLYSFGVLLCRIRHGKQTL